MTLSIVRLLSPENQLGPARRPGVCLGILIWRINCKKPCVHIRSLAYCAAVPKDGR
jgi:hypothetical protein